MMKWIKALPAMVASLALAIMPADEAFATVRAKSALGTNNTGTYTTNGHGGITGSAVRTQQQDAIDSMCGLASAADCALPVGSALVPSNNLSDLINAATARTNLGLSSWAVLAYLPSTLLTFTAGATGAATQFGSELWGEQVWARSYGVSFSDTRTTAASCTSGLSTITLASVIDFVAGRHYAAFYGCGAAETAAAPTSLSLVVNGSAGATSIQYAALTDDNNGGSSGWATINTTTAAATQTTLNHNLLTAIPPNSSMAVAWYKNVNSGGWVYLGAGVTGYSVSSVTPGSGYTGGYYPWTGVGGGCAIEPGGSFFINPSGQLASVRIEPSTPGKGCTGNPTFAVSGAGGGSGAAATLSLVDTIDDSGLVPPLRPNYLPATPSATATNDWLVAEILSFNGLVATISTPVISTNNSSLVVRHDDTASLIAGLAALPNLPISLAQLHLDCGTINVEASQVIIAPSNQILEGERAECTTITTYGNGPSVSFNPTGAAGIAGGGVEHVNFRGYNSTGGSAVYAFAVHDFRTFDISCDHMAQCRQALGINASHFEQTTAADGWGYGTADYDDESTLAHGQTVETVIDQYVNDYASGLTQSASLGGSSRIGWKIDDAATVHTAGNCAVSNVEGIGIAVWGDTGNLGNASQFIHLRCDAEFSRSHDIQVLSCLVGACDNTNGDTNGSILGKELDVEAGASWHELGGTLKSSVAAPGAYLNGTDDSIIGVTVKWNSGGSPGTYAGVEIGSSSNGTSVCTDTIGDAAHPSYQLAPILVDSGAQNATYNNCGNVYLGNAYNHPLNNAGPASINPGVGISILGATGIPIILPSSGTMANNGALTLTTALDLTYASCYVYLPAGAISAGSLAGLYYAVFSSATLAQVYNNTYTSGSPSIPASPTAFVTTGPGAYTQTTGSNIPLLSFTVPGGFLGNNDGLQVEVSATYLNSATSKSIYAAYGSLTLASSTQTTTHQWSGIAGFKNRGTLSSQIITTTSSNFGYGTTSGNVTTGAIASTSNQVFSIGGQLATAATDYIVLQSADLMYRPGMN